MLFSRFVVLYFNLCSFYMFYERLTSPQAADNPTSLTLEVMGITAEVMNKLNLHCTEILLTPAVLLWAWIDYDLQVQHKIHLKLLESVAWRPCRLNL